MHKLINLSIQDCLDLINEAKNALTFEQFTAQGEAEDEKRGGLQDAG